MTKIIKKIKMIISKSQSLQSDLELYISKRRPTNQVDVERAITDFYRQAARGGYNVFR
jgi:hypothetical protein